MPIETGVSVSQDAGDLGHDPSDRRSSPTASRHDRSVSSVLRWGHGAHRPAGVHWRGAQATVLVAPFLVLLLVGGLLPALYALVKSFQANGRVAFGGISAYRTAVGDFRFGPAFQHIGIVMVIWLPVMMVGVVGLALLLHRAPRRMSSIGRFVFYLPGALVGMANLVLWVFILDPTQSPIKPILGFFGLTNIDQVLSPGHLPFVLAMMLFFEGAGTWIVVVYGGLNGIPEEVLEAASLDGASMGQLTRWIKLPLTFPWIAYAALMNVAYGFQLFLEPQVLSLATEGLISPQYTPNQLSYTYAFQIDNIPAASALATILLVISLLVGIVIITKAGLFSTK
jgi:multiple sugar transport system permease protein